MKEAMGEGGEGGAVSCKNNESVSIFLLIRLIIVYFLYIPEHKPIKMKLHVYEVLEKIMQLLKYL
jgi:hypothetical protein